MEEKIDHLVNHVKDYVEERVNLITLNIHEKASKAIAGTASVVILIVMGVFTLGFLSMALAWFIGQQLAQPFLGFLIVGGVYLFVAILLWVNRERWIGLPVMNAFLKNISDEED